MSWSDLFYPGNPQRRTDVIRLCTTLHTLVINNFKTTNDLIDVMHKYLPGKDFEKINFEKDSDIKTNADIIVDKIREIQDYVEARNEKLRMMLEPKLYEDLVSTSTSFKSTIEVAKKVSVQVLASVGSAAGIALVGGIYQGKILVKAVETVGKIRMAVLASLTLGVLLMGVDMIASAIIGAVERNKLDNAIKELEETLETFEPESYRFDKSIQHVAAYLEVSFDD